MNKSGNFYTTPLTIVNMNSHSDKIELKGFLFKGTYSKNANNNGNIKKRGKKNI